MRVSWILALSVLGLGGCLQAAPWGVEGSVGADCFPDASCDPGLRCIAGKCLTDEPPPADGGGVDLRREDGRPPVPDRALAGDQRRDQRRDQQPPKLDKGPSCPWPLPTPLLLPPPKAWPYPKVPIKGTAPAALQVTVSGGAAPKTVKVGVAGVFCVDVELVPNALNSLQVVSVDSLGCTSGPATAEVKQGPFGPINLLYGLAANTKAAPAAGLVAALTDGQTGSSAPTVKFSFADPEVTPGTCDYFEQAWFDLGQTRTVDQVVVRYPSKTSFKNYAVCWDLLASTKFFPAPPDRSHPDWVVVKQGNGTAAGNLTLTIPGTSARHLAFLMYEDAATGYYETFELTEIEAWGPSATPAPEQCP